MTQDAVYAAALKQFASIIDDAGKLGLQDPTRVALATVSADGQPSVRIVLMRGWDDRGFRFFTNRNSRKGRELAANPRAALCFHWEELQRQIRIQGQVELLSPEESDVYWSRRPRESRIGAWASMQSEPLDDRETLARRVAEFDAKFPGEDVPRPDFWCGYIVVPHRIEFWSGLPARLHERDVYELSDGRWTRSMLYP
jgi:pyridoxamine 5'-phosphate oxidase